MENYSKIFKALSDPTRLKIMWLLNTIDSKVSVSEIMEVLGESQYKVSRHLTILKNAGLVTEEKEGRWVFHFLSESTSQFETFIQKAILSLPEELMTLEIQRCQHLLKLRKSQQNNTS